MYIERAKSLGMKALAFSEHGNQLGWDYKKSKIEKAGMKYVHAVEFYVTKNIEEKIRDNRHTILIAKNHKGFKEINKLVSISFNRTDGHFYYSPRITFDELKNISDNIFVTSACLGGILNGSDEEFKNDFINFMKSNKENCFLEIQHHRVKDQIEYNQTLLELHKETGIRLVAGTDTHSLNDEYADARKILQKGKKIFFSDEEDWDLTFKSYDDLIDAYKMQNSIPMEYVIQAIKNTNLIQEQVEEFVIDKSPKYPKLYEDSVGVFRTMAYESIDSHPYALKNHTREELVKRIDEEIEVYIKTNTVDFMLFQKFVRDWEKKNGIFCGPSRGSISGSMIAYLLGVTEMDSMKFDLNFFRFLNPMRQSNCDVDTDYYEPDRNAVRKFLLELDIINTAEIVTFNTVALKGAIRDVGRALEIPLATVDEISKNIESKEGEYRKQYPELFHYADLISGVIVSVGSHPAGVLCSSLDIDEEIGLFTTKSGGYPISCIDMHGLDDQFYVKLDCLGLDNVGLINETCKIAGIKRITPDNIPLDDMDVWNSIREDTTCIFQWESKFASQIIRNLFSDSTMAQVKKNIPNLSMLKLFSFGNGLIRPGCASFRTDASKGIFHDNGLKGINDLLMNEMGYLSMQESIMKFLVLFCGYSDAESDTVRRAIAKKKGTEDLLEEIERRFTSFSKEKYGLNDEECKKIIDPFLKAILDASDYGFSWNHSDAYSYIGYAIAWLRHYYPMEFIAAALNIWCGDEEKTANIISLSQRLKISVSSPRFRHSKSNYMFDRENSVIYKGLSSIKYLSAKCSDDLYSLKDNKYNTFMELLLDISKINVDTRQVDILIKLDFFEEFGNSRELLAILDLFYFFKSGESKQIGIEKACSIGYAKEIIEENSELTKSGKTYINLNITNILNECELYIKNQKLHNIDVSTKVKWQQEYLGYISFQTNNPSDRYKLLVIEIKPLLKKDKSSIYSYSLKCMSMGNSKVQELKVWTNIFNKCKLEEYDIIETDPHDFYQEEYNGIKSWRLSGYRKVGNR